MPKEFFFFYCLSKCTLEILSRHHFLGAKMEIKARVEQDNE